MNVSSSHGNGKTEKAHNEYLRSCVFSTKDQIIALLLNKYTTPQGKELTNKIVFRKIYSLLNQVLPDGQEYLKKVYGEIRDMILRLDKPFIGAWRGNDFIVGTVNSFFNENWGPVQQPSQTTPIQGNGQMK